MDVYACGDTPLIQPRPCPRWYVDKPNACSHVDSGAVDTNAPPGYKACPLLASTPKVISRDHTLAEIRSTAAENLLTLEDDSIGEQVGHCRDGYDRTLEEATLIRLRQDIGDDEIQDIWIDTEFNIPEDDDDDDFGDDLFGDDYPRGPVVQLGLLTRNGAIYRLTQEPYSLVERTTPSSRIRVPHAIIRQECNNGQRDAWPVVVFRSQPRTIYRTRTLEQLLSWLRGDKVEVRQMNLVSPIIQLQTTRGRADHCTALMVTGHVAHWRRDDEDLRSITLDCTLSTALTTPVPEPKSLPNTCPSLIATYRASKVVLGLTMGAVLGRDTGKIYVFSLREPSRKDKATPHILDLDTIVTVIPDGLPSNTGAKRKEHRTLGLFAPHEASINSPPGSPHQTKFVDIAAGNDHLVALTSEGKVWTVGSAFQGQLGIGEKQFQLDDADPKGYEWTHDAAEYAEEWQEMTLPEELRSGSSAKVVAVAAGYQSTILIAQKQSS